MSGVDRSLLDSAEVAELAREVAQSLARELPPAGGWRGALSSSALSTATASFALRQYERWEVAAGRPGSPRRRELARAGLSWLLRHQNGDGGWGDTVRSPSNLSTTLLAWCALARGEGVGGLEASRRAERWIEQRAGGLGSEQLSRALAGIYGQDRTFAAPILTMAALSGRLGEGAAAWRHVQPLPFELAALPQALFRFLGLPVVSYALPALIAVGQARHHCGEPVAPPLRWLRALLRQRTLWVLERLQPQNGGFLEAVPLTSFVLMSLLAAGAGRQPAAARAIGFIEGSALSDGSWRIDTDLSTWLTTLSVQALDGERSLGGRPRPWASALSAAQRERVGRFILEQQHRRRHPYTGAGPGGWAWTDLPGGVPDADDTASAILSLRALQWDKPEARRAAVQGLEWLLRLQNRDGGIPTFCRGWGKLPFDRSGPDLTAHAVRAFLACREELEGRLARRVDRALERACRYLLAAQRADGSWAPLWFGCEENVGHENPLYGTSRTLLALAALRETAMRIAGSPEPASLEAAIRKGVAWTLSAQGEDGGWGGAPGATATVEETALAIEGLSRARGWREAPVQEALARGFRWLRERVRGGTFPPPATIGFYFASLWYQEELYPRIFTLAAMRSLHDAAHDAMDDPGNQRARRLDANGETQGLSTLGLS